MQFNAFRLTCKPSHFHHYVMLIVCIPFNLLVQISEIVVISEIAGKLGGGHRDQEMIGRRRAGARGLSERGPECARHGDEQITAGGLAIRFAEEFPVHVDAVKLVADEELLDALRKARPERGGRVLAIAPHARRGGRA